MANDNDLKKNEEQDTKEREALEDLLDGKIKQEPTPFGEIVEFESSKDIDKAFDDGN